MPELNWNLPLVAEVGEPLSVDGNLFVKHADGVGYFHNTDGTIVGISADVLKRYTLHNRPWRVGDPVVSAEGSTPGVVERISTWTDDYFPILVSFDKYQSWMSADGIRYDYSRRPQVETTRDGHDSDCAMHNEPAFPNGPCDCSTSNPHMEIERQIADVLEYHEAERRDDDLAKQVVSKIAARGFSGSTTPRTVAAEIIALVRSADKERV